MEPFKQADLNFNANTGIHLEGPSIAFKTASNTRMIVNQNGNVGISTINPLKLCHIDTGGTNNEGLIITNSSSSSGQNTIIGITADNTQNGNGFRINGYDLNNTAADGNRKLIFQSTTNGDATHSVNLMTIAADTTVGINTINPKTRLHIVGDNDNAIRLDHTTSGNNWIIYPNSDSSTTTGKLYFLRDNPVFHGGYIQANGGFTAVTFTGQHRNMLNTNINNSSRGLIVSSSGNYLNLDNSLGPSINEALPICTITNTDNDKKVFGVISDKEDNNTSREYASGNWVSVYNKINTNEERMFINSVGEGSMWVCNKNGTLQNGDYITSTTVSGYGGKQITIEGALMNFTVSKITCDCDFSLTKIVKQKLKVTVNSDGTTTIDYDSSGNVQYVDDLDSEGNQQMVYPLETRFLDSDGAQLIDEADYNTRLANGESVYIACFVGCTYHCG